MYIPLLTKIKNAQVLHKETVRFPYSKMDENILTVLANEKFIVSFEKKGKNPKRYFEIHLFTANTKNGITDISFVSTPSRRIYAKQSKLRPVRQGYGRAIVTTSQGIMTNKEARAKKIGGQVLFNIW